MKLHPILTEALKQSGRTWSIEEGRRGVRILLDGKLVGVCPHNISADANRRPVLNVRAQIRRAAKEMS